MSKITYQAHEYISRIIQRLDIGEDENVFPYTLSPIVLEGNDGADPTNWVGYQYLYETKQTPSTRLQITFGNSDLALVPVGGELRNSATLCRKGELRVNWISQFDTHPDSLVKAQILELLAEVEADNYEAYAIPWEKEFELMDKETRDSLAGTPGFFFPILFFHHPVLKYDVVVRCEPVVEVHD